jgi:hypothetical protein
VIEIGRQKHKEAFGISGDMKPTAPSAFPYREGAGQRYGDFSLHFGASNKTTTPPLSPYQND